MAKLRVAPNLIEITLFRGCDKRPVIMGAYWDAESSCLVLDIVGDGVPETDGFIHAVFHERPPITVEFKRADAS